MATRLTRGARLTRPVSLRRPRWGNRLWWSADDGAHPAVLLALTPVCDAETGREGRADRRSSSPSALATKVGLLSSQSLREMMAAKTVLLLATSPGSLDAETAGCLSAMSAIRGGHETKTRFAQSRLRRSAA
jgi:hypothetical protein